MIIGETGVGKELVANVIHRQSNRADGPFIAVNIASLPTGVITSELFGHEKGAFTGAHRPRIGRFELAHGGSLFLDDIQNMSMEIQAQLLRVIQEKSFERVGGTKPIKSDFRLIAATNIPLGQLVNQGQFRSDLYYRMNTFPIEVPPLREIKTDIPLLAMHFLDKYNRQFGKNIKGISNRNIKRLTDYSWPGNIRELQHIIERAVILSNDDSLLLPNLDVGQVSHEKKGDILSLEKVQRRHIVSVLEKCGWKVSGDDGAARLLEMKPSTLYSKIKRLGIERPTFYE